MKYASLGSVSTATLRDDDLLDAFADTLEWCVQDNAEEWCSDDRRKERDAYLKIVRDARELCDEDDNFSDPDDIASDLIEELSDALQNFAPPYCYFGTHEGDGADFGFWPSHDSIEELPHVEDSDGAKALGEDCKFVNDHGNVTVFGSDGSILLELV